MVESWILNVNHNERDAYKGFLPKSQYILALQQVVPIALLFK